MKNVTRRTGISVIVCCYNSAARIKETLEALAKQEFSSPLYWEIVLVDNASTDHTARLSREIWDTLHKEVPLKIIYESVPGLANARRAGIKNAACGYLLFCDDDNRLSPGYVEGIFTILNNNSDIAACGGKGIPLLQLRKPRWFDDYREAYAVGEQSINEEKGKMLTLYGAGMGVNRKMLDCLESTGFQPLLNGRTGKELSSSEDTELTYAFVLMGYRLHYAGDLHFIHYLPKERLRPAYLKKLFIAFGKDGPVRNLYYAHITDRFIHRHIANWSFHMLVALYRLSKYLVIPPKKNGRIIYLHWNAAYIKQLWRIRKNYSAIKENISRITANGKGLSFHPDPATAHPLTYLPESTII